MPTQRFRSRRAPVRQDPTIEAIREGRDIEWSPEAWSTLVGARFFNEHDLTDDEMKRVVELMDEWHDQQREFEQARRLQHMRE